MLNVYLNMSQNFVLNFLYLYKVFIFKMQPCKVNVKIYVGIGQVWHDVNRTEKGLAQMVA